jgi:LPXTG-motif cell wall-anchored protein
LPPGLTLDPATGVISGTPTTADSPTFTVTATNGVGSDATATYTIAASLAVTHPALALTGVDAAPAGLLGGAVLLLGVALLLMRRRLVRGRA